VAAGIAVLALLVVVVMVRVRRADLTGAEAPAETVPAGEFAEGYEPEELAQAIVSE
jgi:hypothetical protein